MLCSVIPYTRSIDDRLVTYHLPDQFKPFVKVGSTVKVPWGKEVIIAIVAHTDPDIPYEGVLKSVESPHCTTPVLSPSEIAMIVQLTRHLFLRIHTVAQLFLPLGIFDALEEKNFLELTPPGNCITPGFVAEYSVAPDPATIILYLKEVLQENPGAIIVPDGISVQWWYEQIGIANAILDPHPRSLARQKKIYLEILAGSQENLFGTRRTLLKRLGKFQHIYCIHENLSQDILCGFHRIPIHIVLKKLMEHGHIIHYIATTPSIRTLTHFLQDKKSIQYLPISRIEQR